jgi:hypothetical protein
VLPGQVNKVKILGINDVLKPPGGACAKVNHQGGANGIK